MNIELLASIIAGIANISLGLIALKSNPKSITNRLLFLITLIISSWIFANYFSLHSTDEINTLLWIRMVMVITTPLGPLLFLFLKSFPDTKLQYDKYRLVILIFLCLIIALLSASKLTFSGVTIENGNIIPTIGIGIIAYFLLTVGFVLAGFVQVIIKYKKAKGIRKTQLLYLATGVVLTFATMIVTNLFFVLILNYSGAVIIGPLSSLMLVGTITYAIVKHRLLDIRLVIARTISYSLLTFFLISFYVIGLYGISMLLFSESFEGIQLVLSVILALITAYTFQPLRSFLERITDSVFYHDNYNPQLLIDQTTKVIASHILLADLAETVLRVIENQMKFKGMGLLVLNEKEEIEKIFCCSSDHSIQEILLKLYMYLENQKSQQVLLFDDLSEGKVKELFRKLNLQAIVPLLLKEKIVGHLLVGEKKSGEVITQRDLAVLGILSRELAVGLQNARAYEEIKNFNTTLKDEVARATKRLKTANKRLLQFDKLKDEFVSLASHELRTPMVSIRNYSWMLFNDKVGKLKPKQKEYARRIYESSTRLTRLVNSMLNISRIESGRILLSVEPTDILNLTQEVITELEGKAKEQGVVIEIKKTAKNLEKNQDQSLEKLPTVMIDSDKIKEVLVNLVGNSLKFTPKGGRVEISFSTDELFVHIQVKDTGAGLEEDEIPKLFKKFGMIRETYLMTAGTVQGTGLGLYICKSIIEMHGGEIGVHSQGRGKGSTFYFSLPKENNSTALKLKSGEKNGKDAGIIHSEVGGY